MNELVQLTIRQQLSGLASLIGGSAWGADRGTNYDELLDEGFDRDEAREFCTLNT